MSERDELLGLLDDLAALLEGSAATTIEVETERLSVSVRRRSAPQPEAAPLRSARAGEAVAEAETVQRVHATAVGIFSATRQWQRGETVTRGTVLGAVQSLGAMADITAPADGTIQEVLVAIGAPVEYGQALFAIALD